MAAHDWSRRVPFVGVLLLALAAAGCTGDETAAGEVTVFAAASLAEALEDVAQGFAAAHPGTSVSLAVAGSQTLAQQLLDGAEASVFAPADDRQMGLVADAGLLAATPRPLAGNRLAIAVAAGNPHRIATLADLADPGLIVVLPDVEVPAGRYAREALDRAGVSVAPVSLEPSVRDAVGKVRLGEADATIAYVTDLVTGQASDGAGGVAVEPVALPPEHDVRATYPIAPLVGAPDAEAAEAFVAYALGAEGQERLRRHGFLPP